MTNIYAVNIPGQPLIDGTKGSMKNRAECAKEHLKNNIATTAKSTVLTTGVGFGSYYAAKHPTRVLDCASKLGKGLEKLANKTPLSKYLKDVNTMKLGKIGLATLVFTTITSIATDILAKHYFKSGQIDQKYTDVAKLENASKNPLLG